MTTEPLIFIIALAVLALFGKIIIQSLVNISRYFGLKEFVVAFFTVSIGAVAPEFFIGVNSALRGIPEVALGNVVGENIFLLTMTVAISTLFTGQGITVESKTVRMGITFTVASALLPLILIMNGELSRLDGLVLISAFVLFTYWLFAKQDRFLKVYDPKEKTVAPQSRRDLLKNLIIVLGGLLIVVASSQALLSSVQVFAESWQLSLTVIGIFFLGFGTALPETYFAITLTRHGQSWMVLGGIMGGVAIASTLVLGIVALIHPITVENITSLVLARIFLTIAAMVFLITINTSNKITKREGLILMTIYLLFLLLEISIPEDSFVTDQLLSAVHNLPQH